MLHNLLLAFRRKLEASVTTYSVYRRERGTRREALVGDDRSTNDAVAAFISSIEGVSASSSVRDSRRATTALLSTLACR